MSQEVSAITGWLARCFHHLGDLEMTRSLAENLRQILQSDGRKDGEATIPVLLDLIGVKLELREWNPPWHTANEQ